MWSWVSGLMMAIGLAWTGCALAQAPAIPENPRFVFPTTPEVVVKLAQPSTTRSIRGKLLSLTAFEVVIDTGKTSPRGEPGQRIAFERIESLRSSDGRFEFTPDEDFQAASLRIVSTFSSVTIESASPATETPSGDPSPARAAHTAAGPIMPKKPPVNGLGQGGFGGIKNLPKPKKTDPVSPEAPATEGGTEGTPEVTEPETPPPVDQTAGATEIFLCSNCAKEIPASAIKTGVCPHCKVAFSNLALPPSKPVSNPFQKPAGNGNAGGGGAFAPTSPAPTDPAVPAPANNNGTQIIQGGGFTLDAIPNWAKGGLFVLLVLVGWHLIFNR